MDFLIKRALADTVLFDPSKGLNLATLLYRVINFGIAVGAPIAVILVIWGAFRIMFARGNPSEIVNGGKTILYAAVGYGIIILAWGILSLVESVLKTG